VEPACLNQHWFSVFATPARAFFSGVTNLAKILSCLCSDYADALNHQAFNYCQNQKGNKQQYNR
jgi:hypothetical protein